MAVSQRQITCPGCGATLNVDGADAAGACPHCRHHVDVPTSPERTDAPVAAHVACPHCSVSLRVNRGIPGQEHKCPKCAKPFVVAEARDALLSPPAPRPAATSSGPHHRLQAIRRKFASEPLEFDVPTSEFASSLDHRLHASRAALDAWLASSVNEQAASFGRWEEAELYRWHLDLPAIAREPGARKRHVKMKRNRLGVPVVDFLTAPIVLPGIDIQAPTAIGALNPFRLVGRPATIGAKALARLLRHATTSRSQQHDARGGFGVGLDGVISSQQVQRWIRRQAAMNAASPNVAELLWYHLPEEEFSVLRDTGDVTSPLAISYLRQLADTDDDTGAACARHGVAVSWLNAAIARELAFALGMLPSGVGYWDIALACWNVTFHDEPFWNYVGQRFRAAGATDEFTAKLRRATPVLLVCLLSRFARAYGQNGEDVAMHRIVAALRRSGLPKNLTSDAASAAVRSSYY